MITSEIFKQKTGEEPINDDLERCNCAHEGTIGHTSCGWCAVHDHPRFMCGCLPNDLVNKNIHLIMG